MSDHDATLTRWLTEHRGILVRISRAYAVDAADEEDLQQDILLALWRSLPSFRADAKPSTWIFQVALNVALTRRRAAGRRPAHDPLDESHEPAADGEGAAMQRLEWTAVLRALRHMAPIDRAILILALEGTTQQDTAEILGITTSNAGVKLHRARRRLMELLEA
jgi:RNA polymerase sigma-70 factor (ECF subfamily)